MKQLIKKIFRYLPVAVTKNQRYDLLTRAVIRRVCRSNSNCIDVGCHKGEILDLMRKAAPLGAHYGFEPIPVLYKALVQKYRNTNCSISDIALSNQEGSASFNYVTSNPSYSGLLRRSYDRPYEEDTSITVRTARLDDVYPAALRAALIKIDVEGAEMLVLEGARETLRRCMPVVIFEHGLGASDVYGTTPSQIYSFFSELGYEVSLLNRWLKHKAALDAAEFGRQFHGKINHYFIAYPATVKA